MGQNWAHTSFSMENTQSPKLRKYWMADQASKQEPRQEGQRQDVVGKVKCRAASLLLQGTLLHTLWVSQGRPPVSVIPLSPGLQHNSQNWFGSRDGQQLENESGQGEQNRLEVLYCGSESWQNTRITWGALKTTDFPAPTPDQLH